MKKIFTFVLLFALFLGAYVTMDKVLEIKTEDSNGSMQRYYELPKDTVDVLMVGSSHVGLNVDNGMLWDDYGIASYSLWGGMQPLWNSYYFLKEGLKTQEPKVVVVEAFLAGTDADYSTQVVAMKNIHSMRFSLDKLKAASASFDTWQGAAEAVWGLPYYHTRFDELDTNDFDFNLYKEDLGINRITLSSDKITHVNPLDYAAITDEEPLSAKNEKYLRMIIDLCKSKDVELVFLISPFEATETEAMKLNTLCRIAEENGVETLNYLREWGGLCLDNSTDFYDIGHLSESGVAKLSASLGAYLHNHFDLPDRRLDEKHIWNQTERETGAVDQAFALTSQFVGDGVSRMLDTGVKLYENRYSSWTILTRISMETVDDAGVYLSCFSEQPENGNYGLLMRKTRENTLTLILGNNINVLLPECTEDEATLGIVKQGETYSVYFNGQLAVDHQELPCPSYGGNLLVGCQELSANGEKFRYSHTQVMNLEVYEQALSEVEILNWEPAELPEMPLPMGQGIDEPEAVYTLPERFAGGEDFDQEAYLDTGLRLLDEAGTRFTLLASVTPQQVQGDAVFFSCFSEEEEHYRGILVRQLDDQSLNVIVGANYGVSIPIELGRPVNLAIVKDGGVYTVYADGEKVLDQLESRADVYDGTLLIGAQRDAEGSIFRVSETRVNSLTVMSGVMDESDILAYDFADAPEPARIVPTSVDYRMPNAFAGDGEENYVDTGVMLYDAPAKDWTLQTTVRTRQGTNDGVYFSCFSEAEEYRGLMLRQNDVDSVTLYMGELVTYTFELTEKNRTLNLVVVKQGDVYRVYANGEFCAETEIPCARYKGTLLVGCQADAGGELFRFSKARVDALEVQDGALSEEEALKLSTRKASSGRFD
jgi:hypothetical protein